MGASSRRLRSTAVTRPFAVIAICLLALANASGCGSSKTNTGDSVSVTDGMQTDSSTGDLAGDAAVVSDSLLDGSGTDSGSPDADQTTDAPLPTDVGPPPAKCGNGIREDGEACDDGDQDNLDGCLETCNKYDTCGSITAITPQVSCKSDVAGLTEMTISGRFIKLNGAFPRVTFGGQDVLNLQFSGCVAPNVATFTGVDPQRVPAVEECSGATFTLPFALSATVANYEVLVQTQGNTQPNCEARKFYSVGDKPSFTAIAVLSPCADTKKVFSVKGDGITAGTTVYFTKSEVNCLTTTDPQEKAKCILPNSQKLITPGVLQVDFSDLEPGIYTVFVSNGSACDADATHEVVVANLPTVLFVDPPVTYSGLSVQATLYLSGLIVKDQNDLKNIKVHIRQTAPTVGSYQVAAIDFPDLNNPNQIQVTLPGGLAAGSYELRVDHFTSECTGLLPDGFEVKSSLQQDVLTRIEPSFGRYDLTTAVTLSGTGGLENGARVYLTPMKVGNPGAALTTVSFISATSITAEIPPFVEQNATPAYYDVIVVNPSGSVGRLGCTLCADADQDPLCQGKVTGTPRDFAKCFTILASDPPRIEDISPGSLVNQGTPKMTISGSGFDPQNATVKLICKLPADPPESAQTFEIISVDTGASTSSALKVSIDMGADVKIAQGSVCIVRVEHPNGSFDEFSALGVTNPAENLPTFVQGPTLLKGRRGLAATHGRMTRSSRFLYVFGGDNGVSNTPEVFADGEVAALSKFGELNSWRPLAQGLLSERTLGQALLVGRSIYLVGGHDGSSALAATHRARILDPADVLRWKTVGVNVPKTPLPDSKLTEGVWYYRVAAVLASGDTFNPGGEELPSDAQPIIIPKQVEKQIDVFLSWSAPNSMKLSPGDDKPTRVAAYRIYRSTTPGQTAEATELLVECKKDDADPQKKACFDTMTFTDRGFANASSDKPRQPGDLAHWLNLAVDLANPKFDLQKARFGGAGTVVFFPRDPQTQGSKDTYYLYLFFGQGKEGANDTLFDSYERLKVQIADDGSHELDPAGWQLVTLSGLTARRHGDVAQLTPFVSTRYTVEQLDQGLTRLIYLGGGFTTVGTLFDASSPIEQSLCASLVQADGSLIKYSDFKADGTITPGCDAMIAYSQDNAGYSLFAAANQLFFWGGVKSAGNPRTTSLSAKICGVGGVCGPSPPTLNGWDALGTGKITIGRFLAGKAFESAHLFILGGLSDQNNSVTTSVESVVW